MTVALPLRNNDAQYTHLHQPLVPIACNDILLPDNASDNGALVIFNAGHMAAPSLIYGFAA